MPLTKPQISLCVDGADHLWMVLAEDCLEDELRLEYRWCKKCGCLTQVGLGSDQQPVAAVDENGQPYLAAPRILELLTD